MKNSQKSPLISMKNRAGAHRRPKIGIGLVLHYLFSGMGDKIYYLGATIERYCKNNYRHLKHALKRAGAATAKVLLAILWVIGEAISGVWHDLVRPFQKMRRSFKSLLIVIKSTEGRGGRYTLERIRLFFKYGWLWNKHLIARMLNYLMPVAALSVCVMVITSMMQLNYALQITYADQVVGCVADESVYDSALNLIQSQMIRGDDASLWTSKISMSMTIVNEKDLATNDVLAKQLVNASGSTIVEATGIYVGGTFVGATTAPAMIEDRLETLLEPARAIANLLSDPAIKVKFAREVTYIDGIFPSQRVIPFDSLIESIVSPSAEPQIIYYAQAGEYASEIAVKNGISPTTLRNLNPGINLESEQPLDYDMALVVAENEPLLRVKIYKQVKTTETVYPDTMKIRNPEMPSSYVLVVKNGVDGMKEVVKETEYDSNGRFLSEIVVSSNVVKPAENTEIVVGTKDTGEGSGVGNTPLFWPVGSGFQHVSRGWRPWANHYAMDLACKEGSEVYAAASGKIIVSQYWGGFGYYVEIDHGNGMYTQYAHNNVLLRDVGDLVKRGDVIALSGNTGNSTGPHLHFAVFTGQSRNSASPTDPAPLIGYYGPT